MISETWLTQMIRESKRKAEKEGLENVDHLISALNNVLHNVEQYINDKSKSSDFEFIYRSAFNDIEQAIDLPEFEGNDIAAEYAAKILGILYNNRAYLKNSGMDSITYRQYCEGVIYLQKRIEAILVTDNKSKHTPTNFHYTPPTEPLPEWAEYLKQLPKRLTFEEIRERYQHFADPLHKAAALRQILAVAEEYAPKATKYQNALLRAFMKTWSGKAIDAYNDGLPPGRSMFVFSPADVEFHEDGGVTFKAARAEPLETEQFESMELQQENWTIPLAQYPDFRSLGELYHPASHFTKQEIMFLKIAVCYAKWLRYLERKLRPIVEHEAAYFEKIAAFKPWPKPNNNFPCDFPAFKKEVFALQPEIRAKYVQNELSRFRRETGLYGHWSEDPKPRPANDGSPNDVIFSIETDVPRGNYPSFIDATDEVRNYYQALINLLGIVSKANAAPKPPTAERETTPKELAAAVLNKLHLPRNTEQSYLEIARRVMKVIPYHVNPDTFATYLRKLNNGNMDFPAYIPDNLPDF